MKYRVVVEQDEKGGYVATVPELPGCVATGSTREEAILKAKQEIKEYFEKLDAHIEPVAFLVRDDAGTTRA
jgi:antitoxin HicB